MEIKPARSALCKQTLHRAELPEHLCRTTQHSRGSKTSLETGGLCLLQLEHREVATPSQYPIPISHPIIPSHHPMPLSHHPMPIFHPIILCHYPIIPSQYSIPLSYAIIPSQCSIPLCHPNISSHPNIPSQCPGAGTPVLHWNEVRSPCGISSSGKSHFPLPFPSPSLEVLLAGEGPEWSQQLPSHPI